MTVKDLINLQIIYNKVANFELFLSPFMNPNPPRKGGRGEIT